MTRPRLDDDGQSVTLDLHGVRVDEAVELAAALVVEAARRGRSTVRLIHGTSTDEQGAERTIKGALTQTLSDGGYAQHVSSSYAMEGMLVLGLAPSPSPQQGRIRIADLQ